MKQPPFRFGIAMSPKPSVFAPLLFTGRLYEGIEALAEAGFAAVELSLRDVNEVDLDFLDKRLHELGLIVSAIATGRVWLEASLCLSDARPETQKQIQETLAGLITLAAHYQASLIIGGVRGKLSGDKDQQIVQRSAAITTLRHLAGIAQELGVTLLLEPINRYETNFINSSNDALELIEEIDQPAVKLLLDTFHMNIEEVDPCQAIHHAGKRLGYVHFADNNRLAPGQGHIDFPKILQTLSEVGYSGCITAEILPIPDDMTALAQTGNYLFSLMKDRK